MIWEERIEINPEELVGKPVIRGTRLSVEFMVELLANDWSEQQILQNYPGITHEDISACLDYATVHRPIRQPPRCLKNNY